MTHIEIAAREGMKAGFKARKRTIKRGGLNLTVGSFADYCDKFGPEVTACQSQMRNKPRNARVVGVQVFADSRADELAELRQRIAELEAEDEAEVVVEKPKARTRKPKADKPKVNVWHPWAIRKHGIPTTVGATFTYKGKRRTTTFKVTKVTRDGSVESVRVA